MSVLTILCHGTDNSRDTATSGGKTLVISKIAELLQGEEGKEWLLLEGAGTERLNEQGVKSKPMAGIFWGKGVEANVDRAVKFATEDFRKAPVTVAQTGNKISTVPATTLNLAGHSRGSITCYKIAHALQKYPGIKINIFAIDPVPGNNGSINKEMYEHIQLGQNVINSFLLLAESEHRLNFRPYVDALYSIGQPNHKFDTIPGTHGGINELSGDQHEAADLVLSRALKFLKKNGSLFTPQVTETCILNDKQALERYASMMMRIKEYKKYASVNLFRARSGQEAKAIGLNFATTSANIDKHRIANVAGDKLTWGGAKPKGLVDIVKSQIREGVAKHTKPEGRDAHHGLNLGTAIERMTGNTAHSLRPNRFFANQQHEKLFANTYSAIFASLNRVERGGESKDLVLFASKVEAFKSTCSPIEKDYLEAYLAARVAG